MIGGRSPRPWAAAVRRRAVTRWTALAALALAAGCTGSAGAPPPDPAALVPGPAGVAVAGTGLEIGFGRAKAGAVAAVSRLIGPPSGRAACNGPSAAGGGPGEVVRWPSGLALHFPQGTLTGWERGGRSAGRLCRAPQLIGMAPPSQGSSARRSPSGVR